MPVADTLKWMLVPQPRPAAAIRLVCFHHAGGGAFAYRDWAARISAQVELIAIQLPGREARAAEPVAQDLPQLVEDIATALEARMRAPYAFFGHSFGAVLAYLVTCRLREGRILPLPSRLFLSAARPPKSGAPKPWSDASDEDLTAHLQGLGGTSPAALSDARVRDQLLPILRADYRLLAACRLPADPVLNTPFSLLRGASDPTLKPERVAQWRELTRAGVREHVLPAAHFYPSSLTPALLDIIGDTLAMDLDMATEPRA